MGFRGHSRAILVIDWLLVVLLVGGIRLSIRLLRGGFRFRPAGSRPVLIMGAGAAGAYGSMKEDVDKRDKVELDSSPTLHATSVDSPPVFIPPPCCLQGNHMPDPPMNDAVCAAWAPWGGSQFRHAIPTPLRGWAQVWNHGGMEGFAP